MVYSEVVLGLCLSSSNLSIGINVNDTMVEKLVNTFGYRVEAVMFPYLDCLLEVVSSVFKITEACA